MDTKYPCYTLRQDLTLVPGIILGAKSARLILNQNSLATKTLLRLDPADTPEWEFLGGIENMVVESAVVSLTSTKARGQDNENVIEYLPWLTKPKDGDAPGCTILVERACYVDHWLNPVEEKRCFQQCDKGAPRPPDFPADFPRHSFGECLLALSRAADCGQVGYTLWFPGSPTLWRLGLLPPHESEADRLEPFFLPLEVYKSAVADAESVYVKSLRGALLAAAD